MGGMALYFKVFKLPFAMFLFGLFAMLLSYGVALELTDISRASGHFLEMFFNLGIAAPVAYASLGFGFAMMALGLGLTYGIRTAWAGFRQLDFGCIFLPRRLGEYGSFLPF